MTKNLLLRAGFDDPRHRALYLVRHAGAPVNSQYWPMDEQMTVFGFGRGYPCCEKYLTAPAVFTVGFAEVARDRPIEFDDIRQTVARSLQPAGAQAEPVEYRTPEPGYCVDGKGSGQCRSS